MEDVKKRSRIDLVCPEGDEKEQRHLRKMIADPAFISRKIFYGSNLCAVHRLQTMIKLDKPIYVGVAILDLSKYYMYEFWYHHIKQRYGDRANLCYTDTDSLIIEIETENVFNDMIEDKELYDFSDYPKDHPVRIAVGEEHIAKNKKVIGKWKDECNGTVALEFAGIRAKMYSLLT